MAGYGNLTKIPELRKRLLFSLLILAVYRVMIFVTVPGVNRAVMKQIMSQASGSLLGMFNMFSGGALMRFSIFALGIMPYISASIIMQLLTIVLPTLEALKKEGAGGQKKITQYTRYGTVVLATFQALGIAIALEAQPGLVIDPSFAFRMNTVITLVTGTMFLMWVGEQITERGIGNGMSLIISLGIVSSLPTAMGMIFQQLNLDSQNPGQMNFSTVAVLIGIFVMVTIATILIIQGHRRIPLQYARRVIGNREAQGGTSYIPLKINYAGVIPVIFASSLLMFPATLAGFLGRGTWFGDMAASISPGSALYMVLFLLLIVFFTYFWTATQFRPDQIATDMKKNGAFVPGVRQGKPTQDYLESTMNKITLLGAVFLAGIAILPSILGSIMAVPQAISYFFGGTALLILVGVVLDTMKQVESHLLMKRYEGFMSRGRVRGRD